MANELPEVAKVVSNYLKTSGRNVAYIDYSTYIQTYLAWYRGDTAWHTYNVYNGVANVECKRVHLGMAKTVCEDEASLEMNEKCKITLSDKKSQEFIDKAKEDNNFEEQASQLVELSKALGTGAFVGGIKENNKPSIDYIHGDMIFPLSWDNGVIYECAFVKIGGTNKDTKYTLIMHEFNKEHKYVIRTVEVDKVGKPMPMTIGADIEKKGQEVYEQVFETGTDIPMFQIIKPNIVNNYDKTNPLGMSIFGNAIDILKSIDAIYDSWYNEFILGKKRIFVKSDLKKVEINPGEGVSDQIDANDVLFYQIDWTGANEDKPPIYETQMQLRTEEHISSLDKQLNLLARKVGLGDGFYSFNNGAVGRTATEVISVNSSLFRNLKKQEQVLRRALKGLVKALLHIGNYLGLGNFDIEQDITIDFDDSIIEDSDKKKENAMAEFNAGLIDQVEYFAITRNMTREQAEEFVAKMKATDTLKTMTSIMNFDGEM